MLNISTKAAEWDDVIAVAEREPDVWASVGIHPHDADTHPDVETETLVDRARHPRVVGIGESGLDFYYDRSDRDRQRASFRSHIAAARESGLPLIVHTRDAEADTAQIPCRGDGEGRLHRRHTLLHGQRRFRRTRTRTRPVHLDVRHRDLQECEGLGRGCCHGTCGQAADRD
jgi:Tat protein secretion system quality control protein TatD with DNase activity